jgi:hypothetical protein
MLWSAFPASWRANLKSNERLPKEERMVLAERSRIDLRVVILACVVVVLFFSVSQARESGMFRGSIKQSHAEAYFHAMVDAMKRGDRPAICDAIGFGFKLQMYDNSPYAGPRGGELNARHYCNGRGKWVPSISGQDQVVLRSITPGPEHRTMTVEFIVGRPSGDGGRISGQMYVDQIERFLGKTTLRRRWVFSGVADASEAHGQAKDEP